MESISHCLLHCDTPNRVWLASNFSIRPDINLSIPFVEWFMNWFKLEKSSFVVNRDIIAEIAFMLVYLELWK